MKEIKIFLIIVAIIAVFVIFTNLQDPPAPEEFVMNQSFSNHSTLFYNYEILRNPSKVEILSLEEMDDGVILGFATEKWNLNFGIIPANGSYSTRNIELSNPTAEKVEILMKAYGNISPLVVFSKNNFVLGPGEKVLVDVFAHSKGFEAGNYTGEIDLIIKRPIYNFLSIS